jgi:murein DD-endopeptidase MepM/ murein hydrolase activator NlpD
MLSVIRQQKVRPRRHRMPAPQPRLRRDILAEVRRKVRRVSAFRPVCGRQRAAFDPAGLWRRLAPRGLVGAVRASAVRALSCPPVAVGLGLGLVVVLSVSVVLGVWAGNVPLEFPGAADLEVLLNAYVFPEEEAEQPVESRSVPGETFAALALHSHRVQPGESLTSIAQKYRLNIDTLVSFNGIRDAGTVVPGMSLSVPNQNGILHTVRWGDSVEKISRSYQSELNRVLDVNNLQSSTILPSQKLFIPGARMRPMDLKKVLGELFIHPAIGTLSSPFGVRNDPFTGIRRFHNGIDIAGDAGTPILAAMPGRIAKIGYHPNYGRYIIMTHADGFQTWYAHLRACLVSEGQKAAQGQKIAEMGSTGYSTGPHLHFSIFLNGSPVDPQRYLK